MLTFTCSINDLTQEFMPRSILLLAKLEEFSIAVDIKFRKGLIRRPVRYGDRTRIDPIARVSVPVVAL
jgi:hypothetical protein